MITVGPANSTPQPAPRTTCDHCLAQSTYMRRDTAGNTHRSCPGHSIEMEIMVREINEWGTDEEDIRRDIVRRSVGSWHDDGASSC